MSKLFDKTRAARTAVYVGMPIAIIFAAAMTARAYDTTWIQSNQKLYAADLKKALDEVQSRLVALEMPTRDCPAGYKATMNNYGSSGLGVLCSNGADQVVKVGLGPSAFWIDRYEASLWDSASGNGKQYGLIDGDANNNSFVRNGQWTTPMYALSKPAVAPSRWLTWFQANEACRMGGKRLATRDEWLTAAGGTLDPGSNDGSKNAQCNTQSTSAALVRNTGMGSACASRWGAEDMIGNVYEWTNEWYAAPGDGVGTAFFAAGSNWPADYNGDATSNLNTWTYSAEPSLPTTAGLPAAALRGGDYENNTKDGIFTLELRFAPSYWAPYAGFRCAIH